MSVQKTLEEIADLSNATEEAFRAGLCRGLQETSSLCEQLAPTISELPGNVSSLTSDGYLECPTTPIALPPHAGLNTINIVKSLRAWSKNVKPQLTKYLLKTLISEWKCVRSFLEELEIVFKNVQSAYIPTFYSLSCMSIIETLPSYLISDSFDCSALDRRQISLLNGIVYLKLIIPLSVPVTNATFVSLPIPTVNGTYLVLD
ncbi:putative polyketide synthase 19, partial [Frankliniella fusca]